MTLSVLFIGNLPNSHCLYESESERIIMRGSYLEMYHLKHDMETIEEQVKDKDAIRFLRNKYMKLLQAGGSTQEEAAEFLKSRMPQLFNNEHTSP